jgi:hypothetical protein
MESKPRCLDRDRFTTEILPKLRDVSGTAMARATGLSVSYCVKIKGGERIPHPRWWASLAALR